MLPSKATSLPMLFINSGGILNRNNFKILPVGKNHIPKNISLVVDILQWFFISIKLIKTYKSPFIQKPLFRLFATANIPGSLYTASAKRFSKMHPTHPQQNSAFYYPFHPRKRAMLETDFSDINIIYISGNERRASQ